MVAIRWLLSSVLVSALSLGPGRPALAQTDDAASAGEDEAGEPEGEAPEAKVVVNPEGVYGGVTPGKAPAPEGKPGKKQARRSGGKPTVTWVGFQPPGEGGGAPRVFVQLTSVVQPTQEVVGDGLVLRLAGARLGPPNITRPLDTTFFQTGVTRVTVRRAKGKSAGVEVYIQTKGKPPGPAATHVETGPDGMSYLFVEVG